MPKLREKIDEVITTYTKNNVNSEREIRNIIQGYCANPSRFEKYTPEYKIDAFKEAVEIETKLIMENVDKTNQLFNQKVKALVAEEKEKILPKPKEKSADYAIRISNALKYLEIEGNQLTDETAFEILKDFIDDYEQMKLFKQVIKRQMHNPFEFEDEEGKCNFPRTFGNYNKMQMLVNTFSEAETIANVIFLKGTKKYETFIFDNARIDLPLLTLPSYDEINNQDEIIKLAEIIDITVDEQNSIVSEKNKVNITE